MASDILEPWRELARRVLSSPDAIENALATAERALCVDAPMSTWEPGDPIPEESEGVRELSWKRLILPGKWVTGGKCLDRYVLVLPVELMPQHITRDMYFRPAEYQEGPLRWQQASVGRPGTSYTVVYDFYDNRGTLLYIGITSSPERRFASHEANSTWMEFATTYRVTRFATRDDAKSAEKAWIETCRPLFNVEYNDHPDRVARLVDYLIDRDRRDLLVPLVSRG